MSKQPEAFFVCREVNRETGEVAVYRVEIDITAEHFTALHFRSIFNPELRYYIADGRWAEAFETVKQILGANRIPESGTLREYRIMQI